MGLNAWLIQLLMQYKWDLPPRIFPVVCCWANCMELAVNRRCWPLASSHRALFFSLEDCLPAAAPLPAPNPGSDFTSIHPVEWTPENICDLMLVMTKQTKSRMHLQSIGNGLSYGKVHSFHSFFSPSDCIAAFYTDWEQKITSRGNCLSCTPGMNPGIYF